MWVWPTIQHGIASIQHFIIASGYVGVWLYHFLERVLIPTGLHHFIYAPIEVGVVKSRFKSRMVTAFESIC